jgi:predicted nucleic acid-binding protein
MGMMSKWFALMDIRQVDFDGGQANSGNRIADRHARMGIGGRIDDDAVIAASALLNPIHQVSLAIRLVNVDVQP